MIIILKAGPRNGLQTKIEHVSADVKIAFVDVLSDSGVSKINYLLHRRRYDFFFEADGIYC